MTKKILLFMLMLNVFGISTLKAEEATEPAKPPYFTNLKNETKKRLEKTVDYLKKINYSRKLKSASFATLGILQFYCMYYCMVDAPIAFTKLLKIFRNLTPQQKKELLINSGQDLIFDALAVPTFFVLGVACMAIISENKGD